MLLLVGCKKETGTTEGDTASQGSQASQESHSFLDNILSGLQKEEEREEDNAANHGVLAIMETEDGYYYNAGCNTYLFIEEGAINVAQNSQKHRLRYYDKASGQAIVLCNKPECEHRGDDTCAATYKELNVINSVLYEDKIYIYGLEEDGTMLRLNLYRAALDGSSIDKVGTVLEAENTIGAEYKFKPVTSVDSDFYFIIHKGSAYIPYYLTIGETTNGFQGGGLVKMDLQTGETKTLHEMEYKINPYPGNLWGCGDYVYINFIQGTVYLNKGSERYVISQDIVEGLPSDKDLKYPMTYDAFAAERYYTLELSYDPETGEIGEFYGIGVRDAVTGEYLKDETFMTDITREETKYFKSVTIYEDMMVLGTKERVVFYSLAAEDRGTKLGEIEYVQEFPELSMYLPFLEYKVANGKLYRITEGERVPAYDIEAQVYREYEVYEVFYCPLEDIMNGKGEWTKAFSYEAAEVM